MAPKQKPQQQPASRPWQWYLTPEGLKNELLYRARQTAKFNQGQKLIVGSAANPLMGGDPVYYDTRKKPTDISAYSPALRSSQQVTAGVFAQAPANAALAVVNLGQRLLSGQPLKPQKPENSAAGKAVIGLQQWATKNLGVTPPSQLSADDRGFFNDLPASVATNVALGFAPFLRVGSMAGIASNVPFLSQGAQQVLARALQWGANVGINEAASGLLDDSTQGQGGDLLKAAGVPVPDAFLTTPQDDRISAGLKGVLPGIAFGELLGAPLGLVTRASEFAPNAMRNLREQRIGTDVGRVRQEMVGAGLQQPDGVGGYQFSKDVATEEAAAKPAKAPAVAPAMSEPAAAPTADAGLTPPPELSLDQLPEPVGAGVVDDPAAVPSYDPSLLEVDAAALAMDQLDDQQLGAIAQGSGPVLPRIEEALASRQLPEVDGGRSTTWTAAPTESLVTPEVSWRDQWEGLPNTELVGAAHPDVSPDLFEKTQAITGKGWEEFTRRDVLDGMESLQQEGSTVIPQRLGEGQVLADVQGLQVDPARMQFRSGADPETGVVPGTEIQGQWDPSKEGKLKIWEDPQTGDQLVVDGHRRVDAARRLGIPTIPVEEVIAPTAEAARAQGANTNIAQGSAGFVDGARAFREQGITDPATAEAAGLPLNQGTTAGSTAIAGLPDPLFRAVDAGELPAGRAMAIGGSGLDEAGQVAALRFSRSPRSSQLSEGTFNELMQMAGVGAKDAAAAATEGAPVKGMTVLDFDRLVPKAQLADTTRQGLKGRALELFDQGKLDPANPVSQLLDQSAAEVAGGARVDVVVRRLQRQFAEAEAAMPPVEQAAAAIPEQAAPAVAGPMTAADRAALRQQLLEEAVANGEVRPSAQPMIPAPDAPAVDIREGLSDLERQLMDTGTIAPDTPAARLLEDEARLEAEYAARDAFVQEEIRRAQREAAGFWNLPFDERVRQGLISDGRTPEVALQSQSQVAATSIPAEAVKPYDSLSKAEQAKAVADLNRALGTNDAGLNQNGGYAFSQRKLELNGQVDLDAVLGPEKAAKARQQFMAKELGPEAMEARQALRDFYNFKPTTAEKPFYIELGGDDAAINQVHDQLRDIVRQVAGPDADVRLFDRYKIYTTTAAWGGDGVGQSRIKGSYHLMKDLVEINGLMDGTQKDLIGTDHEAFHRVQYGLLTPEEMRVMDSAYGLRKINGYSSLSSKDVATIERQAVAFQDYAAAKRAGGDLAQREAVAGIIKSLPESTSAKVAELAMAVAKGFDKVLDVMDRVTNATQGNGFQTLNDVFERIYSGDIARERAFNSALELMTSNNVERAKTLQRWRIDNTAPQQDITAAISSLDQQIEALKAKATSGGC